MACLEPNSSSPSACLSEASWSAFSGTLEALSILACSVSTALATCWAQRVTAAFVSVGDRWNTHKSSTATQEISNCPEKTIIRIGFWGPLYYKYNTL